MVSGQCSGRYRASATNWRATLMRVGRAKTHNSIFKPVKSLPQKSALNGWYRGALSVSSCQWGVKLKCNWPNCLSVGRVGESRVRDDRNDAPIGRVGHNTGNRLGGREFTTQSLICVRWETCDRPRMDGTVSSRSAIVGTEKNSHAMPLLTGG